MIGLPDKAAIGWDTHFGYGRVNLAGAMARIKAQRIPPEAQIDSPDWFAPLNVDRVPGEGVPVRGRARARGAGVGAWEIDIACGQDAADSTFTPLLTGNGAVDGAFGNIPRAKLIELANTCNGEVAADAGRPAGAPRDRLAGGPVSRSRTRSATPSRSVSPCTPPVTRRTSAATARRCTPTSTTATCRAGRGRSARAPTHRATARRPAARRRRVSTTSTATTRWT